jgi:hypothetical protein
MEFEFNFGQTTLAQGVKKDEAVYASVTGVALPVSSDELVFMNRKTGENHVMTDKVLHALSLCQAFKPLDQHIIAISQNIPDLKTQIQAIEQVTKFLINKDLLIEDKEWIKNISIASSQRSIEKGGIVIRTCDRPKQLNRLLQSLVSYQNKFKCKLPVQIYDDSSSEKLENEVEAICQEFKKDLNINFYGSKWQAQFLTMLKKEFNEKQSVVDWLMASKNGQFTGGRVWNFALLNNAGKKVLFFDDDYIFESRILDEESKTLDLNEKPDLSVNFSLSLSDIRESSNVYEVDVLSNMLNTCGQSVGNWLSTNDIEFGSLINLNLTDLQRINSDSIIKSTCNGTWGSPRSNNNNWLYFLEGEQKEQFWKSREVYLDNIEASNLMHYSKNYEFLSMAKFSPSAIDNSTMTPFASPIDRVEDHFFNALSLFCYPHQVSLHYPYMMGHIQTKKRDRSSTNHIAIKPNFNQFIADYAMTLVNSTDAIDPSLRLKTLANYIHGLADSSDKNLHNRLKEYLSQMRSNMVLDLQEQLDNSPEAPVYWQADVRELIEANAKAILNNGIPILGGWDEDLSEEDCVELARNKLREVADAIQLWPDVWEFCQIN